MTRVEDGAESDDGNISFKPGGNVLASPLGSLIAARRCSGCCIKFLNYERCAPLSGVTCAPGPVSVGKSPEIIRVAAGVISTHIRRELTAPRQTSAGQGEAEGEM
jgi:hypothetical protein